MTGPQRAPQARAIEKKRRILQAATSLMANGGLQAVTHRQVAALAGVPVGSIGYYFSSREELLIKSFEEMERVTIAAFEKSVDNLGDSTSAEEAARIILNVFLGGEVDSQRLVNYFATYVDVVREEGYIRSAVRAHSKVCSEYINKVLDSMGYEDMTAADVFFTISGAVIPNIHESDQGLVEIAQQALTRMLAA